MQKLSLALVVVALFSACTVEPAATTGWTSDPKLARSTDAFVFLHGSKAAVDGVSREAAALGYVSVEAARSPSGAAFALLRAPVALETDVGTRLWEIAQRYRVTIGPAIPGATLQQQPNP